MESAQWSGPALPIRCPSCGRTNESHDHATGAPTAPSVGDIGVCWGCKSLFIYVGTRTARRPTADELGKLYADPLIAAAMVACRETGTPSEAVGLTRRILAEEGS